MAWTVEWPGFSVPREAKPLPENWHPHECVRGFIFDKETGPRLYMGWVRILTGKRTLLDNREFAYPDGRLRRTSSIYIGIVTYAPAGLGSFSVSTQGGMVMGYDLGTMHWAEDGWVVIPGRDNPRGTTFSAIPTYEAAAAKLIEVRAGGAQADTIAAMAEVMALDIG